MLNLIFAFHTVFEHLLDYCDIEFVGLCANLYDSESKPNHIVLERFADVSNIQGMATILREGWLWFRLGFMVSNDTCIAALMK